MKQSRVIIAAVAIVAASSFAIGSLARMPIHEDPPKKANEKKKDKIAAALDSLEQQLQRRFHDRQNIQFGYSRVVRPDARMHGSVVSGIGSRLLRDDGKPVQYRQVNGEHEYEVAAGVWVKASELRQFLHPENDVEKKLKEDLNQTDVAIYTAGAFDPNSGVPTRIKGPAYLRQTSATAPEAPTIGKTVATAWKTTSDADEMRVNGWLYKVVKVKADDESCLNCHNSMHPIEEGAEQSGRAKAIRLNEPLGAFVIATRIK